MSVFPESLNDAIDFGLSHARNIFVLCEKYEVDTAFVGIEIQGKLSLRNRRIALLKSLELRVLNVEDPGNLAGVRVSAASAPDMEASIYLGSAHNWYQIADLSFFEDGEDFILHCEGTVQFEDEGVAKNEQFTFSAKARYVGEA